jgi:hypothetical protein
VVVFVVVLAKARTHYHRLQSGGALAVI